jgi:hypothetical protein
MLKRDVQPELSIYNVDLLMEMDMALLATETGMPKAFQVLQQNMRRT